MRLGAAVDGHRGGSCASRGRCCHRTDPCGRPACRPIRPSERRHGDDRRDRLRDALRVKPGARVRLGDLDPAETHGCDKERRRRAATAARAADRPPGPPLGGGEARGPGRPPGHRRRRQGRHDPARHGGVQPAGLPGHVVQGPDRRGARPRLPVARPPARCRARARSGSSTARTTRTCWSCASTSWSRRRSGRGATTRSTTSSGMLDRERHDDRQVLPVDRQGRAARAVPGALRRPDEALEVLDSATSRSASSGTTTWPPTRTCCRRCSTESAPWYVIPANRKWFRNLAVATILADTIDGLKPAYPPARGPAAGPRHRVGAAAATPRSRGQRLLPPPKRVPKTPRMMSWPSREVTTRPPVRTRCRSSSGAPSPRPPRPSRRPRCALALARASLGGRHLARLARDLALLLGRRHRVQAARGRRVDAWPAIAASAGGLRAPRASRAGDQLVGALAIDGRAVLGLERAGRDRAAELRLGRSAPSANRAAAAGSRRAASARPSATGR